MNDTIMTQTRTKGERKKKKPHKRKKQVDRINTPIYRLAALVIVQDAK